MGSEKGLKAFCARDRYWQAVKRQKGGLIIKVIHMFTELSPARFFYKKRAGGARETKRGTYY